MHTTALQTRAHLSRDMGVEGEGVVRWLGRDIKFSLSRAQIKARSINKQRVAHFMPHTEGERERDRESEWG